MSKLIQPKPEAILYEDERLYCCLATYQITKGHLVVVWKDSVCDLHLLDRNDYEYLMWVVDRSRDALLKTFGLKKVYLLYMDEVNQVHWHLVPRYDEKGFNILNNEPRETFDFSLVDIIKENLFIN